jgi:multiple sugar transport system permease protein
MHSAKTARYRDVLVAYALMGPAVLLVLGVLAYPVAWEVWVSLTSLSGRSETRGFVGLANYRTMVGDLFFWKAVATTIVYFAVTTVAKLVLGFAMALLLARPARWRPLVFLAVFLPWAYPGGVTVIAWYWMLNPPLVTSYSVAAGHLKLAVDTALGGGAYAFLSVILFNIWRGGSFTAVFLLAAINAIPTELFEYAALETRNAWQRFRHVTLPLLMPTLVVAVLLRGIDALKTFDILYATKGKGGGSFHEVETLNVYAYGLSFDYNEYGVSSAVLIIFFLIIIGSMWAVTARRKDVS